MDDTNTPPPDDHATDEMEPIRDPDGDDELAVEAYDDAVRVTDDDRPVGAAADPIDFQAVARASAGAAQLDRLHREVEELRAQHAHKDGELARLRGAHDTTARELERAKTRAVALEKEIQTSQTARPAAAALPPGPRYVVQIDSGPAWLAIFLLLAMYGGVCWLFVNWRTGGACVDPWGVWDYISFANFDVTYAGVIGLATALVALIVLHFACSVLPHGIDWVGRVWQMVLSAAITMLLVGVLSGLVAGVFLPGYARWEMANEAVQADYQTNTIVVRFAVDAEGTALGYDARVFVGRDTGAAEARIQGAAADQFEQALDARVEYLRKQYADARYLAEDYDRELGEGMRQILDRVARKHDLTHSRLRVVQIVGGLAE